MITGTLQAFGVVLFAIIAGCLAGGWVDWQDARAERKRKRLTDMACDEMLDYLDERDERYHGEETDKRTPAQIADDSDKLHGRYFGGNW